MYFALEKWLNINYLYYHNTSPNSQATIRWFGAGESKNVTPISHPTPISNALTDWKCGGYHPLVSSRWYQFQTWPGNSKISLCDSPYSLPQLIAIRWGIMLDFCTVYNVAYRSRSQKSTSLYSNPLIRQFWPRLLNFKSTFMLYGILCWSHHNTTYVVIKHDWMSKRCRSLTGQRVLLSY